MMRIIRHYPILLSTIIHMLWEIKYLMGQKAIDIYICNAFGGFCPIIEVIIKIKTITTCGQNPCKIVKCFF